MARGWPPSSRQARSRSCSPSRPSAGSEVARSIAPAWDSGPSGRNAIRRPATSGTANRCRQVIRSRPRCGRPAQNFSTPTSSGSRIVQVPASSDRFSSKSSRTSSSGTRPSTCSRSRLIRCGQGRTARSTAATAEATAPPRSAASGCRRTAVHTAARNVSGVTSPVSDAVAQSGSRSGRRAAICPARTDFPMPPTPCTTMTARADPASSADQRRRSADRRARARERVRTGFSRLGVPPVDSQPDDLGAGPVGRVPAPGRRQVVRVGRGIGICSRFAR